MEFDERGIALGNTTEDRKFRKKFIVDFYAKWNMAIPTKHIYNKSLNSFIEVRFLSINETARIASYRYISTLAVTLLTEILEMQNKSEQKSPSQTIKTKSVFLKF